MQTQIGREPAGRAAPRRRFARSAFLYDNYKGSFTERRKRFFCNNALASSLGARNLRTASTSQG